MTLSQIASSFPHYNIVKTGDNKYDIEIALVGYNKKDIEVELKEGLLSIKSKKEKKEDTKDEKSYIKVLLKDTSQNLSQSLMTLL